MGGVEEGMILEVDRWFFRRVRWNQARAAVPSRTHPWAFYIIVKKCPPLITFLLLGSLEAAW